MERGPDDGDRHEHRALHRDGIDAIRIERASGNADTGLVGGWHLSYCGRPRSPECQRRATHDFADDGRFAVGRTKGLDLHAPVARRRGRRLMATIFLHVPRYARRAAPAVWSSQWADIELGNIERALKP